MDSISAYLNTDVNPHTQQFKTAKLTHIVITICILALLSQIPIILYSLGSDALQHLLLILFHLVLLANALFYANSNRTACAKQLLVITYLSYVTSITLSFGLQLDTHYFYLLGLFVIPTLFFENSFVKTFLLMLLFAALFISVAAIEYLQSIGPTTIKHESMLLMTNHVFLALTSFGISTAMYITLRRNWRFISQQQNTLESLLSNILPTAISKRLNEGHNMIADEISCCSIIFADLCGFTEYSQHVSSKKLVKTLNALFCEFDLLCQQFGLEKIKTIGDQYMAAAGVPNETENHAYDSCRYAQEMLRVFYLWREKHNINIGIRIGVHSGSVIAGVIGHHKFTYDLWGENVNYASRMESHGIKNGIQVSENTYRLCRNQLSFKVRRKVHLKGIGYHNTYLLSESEQQ